MAINVQVKGDNKFNDSFTTTDCCNSSYVNDSFGQSGQAWSVPMTAAGAHPAYTTLMPDGLYSQQMLGSRIPASLTSLYGPEFAFPFGYQGIKPMATGFAGAAVNTTANTAPFATTFGPSAGGITYAGQAAPWAAQLLGADVRSMNAVMTSPLVQTVASDVATVLSMEFGISPIVASRIASTAIASPIAGISMAVQSGVHPTLFTQLFIKVLLTTLFNAAHADATSGSTTTWSGNPAGAHFMPNASMMPVDIYETEDEYILLSDMPGASIEDIDILIENQMLVVKGFITSGRRDTFGMDSSAVAVVQEKPAAKKFQRVFPISSNVLPDKLTATLMNGVLTVKLPKTKVGFESTRRVAVATA